MTAPLYPQQFTPITDDLILKSAQGIAVSCPWCQRIMRVCDGTLTLAEIAQKVHLPRKVCEKLVTKAVQENWMQVVNGTDPLPAHQTPTQPEAGDFWFELNRTLQDSLGNAGVRLLQEAAQMTRLKDKTLTQQEIENFLIALELAATEQERVQLNDQLDDLRSRYAA